MGFGQLVLLTNPPAPEARARTLVASVIPKGGVIGIVPNPAGAGLVGLPVHLWVTGPNAWGTLPAAVAGIQLTATSTAIVWDLVETTIVCNNPGRPYQPSFGADPPLCGYTYKAPSRNQPNGVYTVKATTTWRVDWTVGGSKGTFDVTRASEPVQIRIEELQVVVH